MWQAGTVFLLEARMSEIEFSINNSSENPAEAIQPLLATFRVQNRVNVSVVVYDWANAWTEFMNISLYGHGPVNSQTSNSWMGSLIGLNTLMAFKGREVAGR